MTTERMRVSVSCWGCLFWVLVLVALVVLVEVTPEVIGWIEAHLGGDA